MSSTAIISSLPVSPAGRRYGYMPGPRSYPLARLSFMLDKAPTRNLVTNNAPYLGAVKDQTTLGCCTAESGSGDREYAFRRYRNESPIFSPLFMYWQERNHDGDLAQGDTGSTGDTSCWVADNVGICLESSMPFDPTNFQAAPTDAQLAEAKKYAGGAYHSVMTLDDIRSCLNSGYCVRVGFTVYESFESDQVANTGMMPMPNKAHEQILGGHEVLFFDCDDSKEACKVRNSWGASWGLEGNFWFPYKAIQDPDIFMDGRMQHFGKPWVPKTKTA